jgi:phospholipid/cholesterol/gamma-HCH transport system substrate-binding protein
LAGDAVEQAERESHVRRNVALVALAVAVAAVIALLLVGGNPYTVTAEFENASQLVPGNQVQVAGVPAGEVTEISLSDDDTALVELEIGDDYAPLPKGTVATIRSQSLSGIANRYVQLQMPEGDRAGAPIPDEGNLGLSDTVSEVDLDQLFNTLDRRSIRGFKDVIKGFARAYDGIGPQTNQGFKYLNPFLSTSREVLSELAVDQRRFERLIIDTSSLSGALAERAPELEQFVSNTNRMMAAIGSENAALADAIGQLPGFMRNFNTTGVNLRATLDDLDPLVEAAKPVARRLGPFTQRLRGLATDAVPTVRDLDSIVRRPGRDNDLTELTRLQAPLAEIAVGPVDRNGAGRRGALPESVAALEDALPQLAFFRPYTPELIGWFDDFGHTGFWDANGSFARQSIIFNAFILDPTTGRPESPIPFGERGDLFKALADTFNTKRCPGSMERDRDGTIPFTDPGGQPGGESLDCDPSQVPSGP